MNMDFERAEKLIGDMIDNMKREACMNECREIRTMCESVGITLVASRITGRVDVGLLLSYALVAWSQGRWAEACNALVPVIAPDPSDPKGFPECLPIVHPYHEMKPSEN